MKEKFKTPQTAIRWLFAGFTLLCLLAAVISAILYRWSASDVFAGLGRICTQSGQTVKSYFDSSYGGFGGTFLNAALVCAVCLGIYCLPGSKPDGVSVLAFFLTAGFCFWGTTILNIWFSFAGVLASASFLRWLSAFLSASSSLLSCRTARRCTRATTFITQPCPSA